MANRVLETVTMAFADDHGSRLCDPHEARDRCQEMALAFAIRCSDAGLDAQVVSGVQFGEIPEFPGVRLILRGHFATHISETGDVIDWTARQFDPAARVPTVTPFAEWRACWPEVSQDDPA